MGLNHQRRGIKVGNDGAARSWDRRLSRSKTSRADREQRVKAMRHIEADCPLNICTLIVPETLRISIDKITLFLQIPSKGQKSWLQIQFFDSGDSIIEFRNEFVDSRGWITVENIPSRTIYLISERQPNGSKYFCFLRPDIIANYHVMERYDPWIKNGNIDECTYGILID